MVFMCCHPALPRDARVALSLKTVGGFSIAEIARAFLASDATIAQRIVRAKRQLRDATDPVRAAGRRRALSQRLESVLEVIYLMFNEGYAAHTGGDARPAGSLPRSHPPRAPGGRLPGRRPAVRARAGRADGVSRRTDPGQSLSFGRDGAARGPGSLALGRAA